MQLLYKRIHQRCPLPQLLETVLAADAPLVTGDFVSQFARARERNAYYAKTLVKLLIDNWSAIERQVSVEPWLIEDESENTSSEVYLDEWLYEQYVELLPVGPPAPTKTDVISYSFGAITVDVEETPYLICASGTTGFRTWEAALYLCHYLQRLGTDPQVTSMLELGAGTALVSLVWAQLQAHLQPRKDYKIYITDGDENLVQTCAKQNFVRNGMTDSCYLFNKIWWNTDPVPCVDLVLAADVTYDSAAIPDLVACLATALHQGAHRALVAATVRNQDTTAAFENACSDFGLACVVIESTETSDPSDFVRNCTFRQLIAPIRIYEVTMPRL